MMLPVIFRKKRSYYYRQGAYGRNGKRKRRGCALPLLLLSVAIAGLWALWYYYPASSGERQESDAILLTETRYVIYNDTTALFSFTTIEGDTLLGDIETVKAGEKTPCLTDTVNAQWVRRWELLPYNGHTLMIEATDTDAICRMDHNALKALLERQSRHIERTGRNVETQLKDVEDFLRTHTVLDNGFDIVARYGKRQEKYRQALHSAANIVKKAARANRLSARMERRYFITADSAGRKIECLPIESNDSVILLTLAESYDRPHFTTRLNSRTDALATLRARERHSKPLTVSAIDSIGRYTGDRDSIALPHGYGCLTTENGEYYEGEWQHGRRAGVGFSITPEQKLKLGEWKEDIFLGERITYTPERIYGIDISRHQHEKGRKRYSINWKNLRIVSLGKMSQKIIHGKVDYPVRFIFIKATEGVTVRNKYFATDYAAARKHGYKTGAYHFFSTRTTGSQQAYNFLRNSRYTQGDLPPALDLEPTDAQIKKMGGINTLFRNVRQWLDIVEKQRGIRPILYISQRFVNKYLSLAPDLHNNYDVWIARYGEYKPDVNLVYWQLSPDGSVTGIHGHVDINVYNGLEF